MSRHDARARSGSDRTSLYDEITGKIVAELEAGRLPWVQPWGTASAKAPLAMPKNAATGRQYSGVNVLILWGAVVARGFSCQSWLTFRQALSLGGNVRKGEHGTTVVYADRFVPDEEKRRSRETGDEAQPIPFLKRFTVFSTDQCENLPEGLVTAPPPVPDGLILPEVEDLIRASRADLRLGGDKAFYSPIADYIQVPRRVRRSNRQWRTRMIIATALSIAGLGFFCWLLFTFAIYALPFFAGLTAGLFAYNSGAGPLGALFVALSAGVITLVVGQFLFAVVRSPLLRTLIAAAFAAPAAVAGYDIVHGLSGIGGTAETWRQVFGLVGAVVIGGVAWVRMGALQPVSPGQGDASALNGRPALNGAANES